MHVAKINILSRVLDDECHNNRFVIIIKIEKFDIDNILLIVMM